MKTRGEAFRSVMECAAEPSLQLSASLSVEIGARGKLRAVH